MNIESLDLLLVYMYGNRNKMEGLLFDQIHQDYNNIEKVSIKEMHILLDKLVDDGYVTKKPTEAIEKNLETDEIIRRFSRPLFYISFSGILFFEKPSFYCNKKPYRYTQSIDNLS